MIVDTSWVLDLLEGDHHAFDKGQELVEDGVVYRIPTVVIAELLTGVSALDGTHRDEEARKVENVIMGLPRVSMDERIARRAGLFAGRVTNPDLGDMIVAATADQVGEPVLTGNAADFEDVGTVVVETY